MKQSYEITSDEFHKIKATILEYKNSKDVKKLYHIDSKTFNCIKRCMTYYEYCLRTEVIKTPKALKVILPNCGFELIDYLPKQWKGYQK